VIGDPKLGELARTHALSNPKIKASLRQIVQHGGLSSESEGMMKRQRVDIVAKPHTPGALQRGSDYQIGTGQDRVVSEVMLGEPALPEPKRFCQHDLVEHLGVGLIMRHAPPLTVVE